MNGAAGWSPRPAGRVSPRGKEEGSRPPIRERNSYVPGGRGSPTELEAKAGRARDLLAAHTGLWEPPAALAPDPKAVVPSDAPAPARSFAEERICAQSWWRKGGCSGQNLQASRNRTESDFRPRGWGQTETRKGGRSRAGSAHVLVTDGPACQSCSGSRKPAKPGSGRSLADVGSGHADGGGDASGTGSGPGPTVRPGLPAGRRGGSVLLWRRWWTKSGALGWGSVGSKRPRPGLGHLRIYILD